MAGKEPANKTAPRGGGLKDFLAGLVTGVLLCGLVGGYFAVRKKPAVRQAQNATAAAIQDAVTALDAKLEAWHLTSGDIEKEFTQTGKVVRRRMSDFGVAVADAATDARATARVKAKFALDKELSANRISVSTTDGVVTLSGTADSYAQIGRACLLANETDGVREVLSTVKVKAKAP